MDLGMQFRVVFNFFAALCCFLAMTSCNGQYIDSVQFYAIQMNATTPFAWQAGQVMSTGESFTFREGKVIERITELRNKAIMDTTGIVSDSTVFLDLRAVFLVFSHGEVESVIGYDGGWQMTVNGKERERDNALLCLAGKKIRTQRIRTSIQGYCP